jgi:hypothetical protein
MRFCAAAPEHDAYRPASRDPLKDQCAAAEALVIGMRRDDDSAALSSGEDPRNGSGEPPAGDGRNREADFHGQKRSNETHA